MQIAQTLDNRPILGEDDGGTPVCFGVDPNDVCSGQGLVEVVYATSRDGDPLLLPQGIERCPGCIRCYQDDDAELGEAVA